MDYLKKIILPLSFLGIAIGLYFAIKFQFDVETSIYKILHSIDIVCIIAGFAWCLITVLHILKHFILLNYDLTEENNLHSRKIYTQFNIIEKVMITIIVLIAIFILCLSFDGLKQIGVSLFASAGLAGLVIGVAAQKVISSLLAGIQIAITQPIRLGDMVVVEKELGTIEEITLTYVVIAIWGKRRLVVPSSYFMDKPFENWTKNSSDILGTIFIYVDYTMPIDKLREKFESLLNAHPLWDKQAKSLIVNELNSSNIEIRALISAKNSSDSWDLRVNLRESLLTFIQQEYPLSLPKTRIVVQENKV